MNILTKVAVILIPTLALSMSVSAHDPKLHGKKAEKADCSKMDHTKMDMKDPVSMAMMKKCMKQEKHATEEKAKMDHSKMDMKKEPKKEVDTIEG
ncbi:MAG: hypothetical protein MJK12_06455 [Colwellia sp.]|nr:hypothetical protein [Colwellia sp.]